MKRLYFALIFILMLLLSLFACDPEISAVPQEISIESTSLEDYYIIDTSFNYSDIKLNIIYSDGTTGQIPLTSSMVTGLDTGVAGEQTVTITYDDKTTTITLKLVPLTCSVTYISGENGTIAGTVNQTINYGEDASNVVAIPNEGYVFDGWSDGYNNARRSDKNITDNLSVTANYKEETFAVKFYDRNGNLITTCNVIKGGQVIAPTDDLSVEGFNFIGWTKRSNGASVSLSDITANLDVVATYSIKKVNASFYDRNNQLIITNSYNYGDTVIPPAAESVYGYVFSHWVIRNSSGSAVFTNLISDTEYTTVYSLIDFTINFNSNGGSQVSPLDVTYMSSPSSLPVASLTGMSFLGWFTAPSGGTEVNTNTIISANITVYAQWTAMYCSVFYNTLGGTSIASSSVLYGGKINPPSSPSKTGYTFKGWYTDEVEGITYNFNNLIFSNIIIYARWTPISYDIKFMSLSGTAVPNITANYETTITSPVSTKQGNTLLGWTLNTVTNTPFDFNTAVTGAMTLYAIWQEQVITVNASCNAGGSVNPGGDISIGYDKSIAIIITPSNGYKIKSMTVNGIAVSITNTYTLNRSWSALYVEFEIITYEITATIKQSGGSITPSGKSIVNHGSSLTYIFTPSTGYKIDLIRVNNQSVGTVSSYTFNNITANQTIDIYFSIITYTVVSTATNGGTITPQGTVLAGYNTNKYFTITPNSNYHISSIKINGTEQNIPNNKQTMTVSLTNIKENYTVAVIFEGDRYTVTASAGANGTITPSGVISENFGTSIIFTMIPSNGYKVQMITVNGQEIGSPSSYTFSATEISSSNTISVSFELDSYDVNWSIIGSGSCQINGETPINYGELRSFNVTPSAHNHLAVAKFTMNNTVTTLTEGDDTPVYSFLDNGDYYTLTVKVMTNDIFIDLNFAIDTFTLTVNPGLNGKVIINSEITVTESYSMNVVYGAAVSLNVMSDTGYHISEIIKNGTPLTGYEPSTHTFSINAINSNQIVLTSYTINSYIVSIDVTGSGNVLYNGTPVNSFTVNYGATPSINLVAETGYHAGILKINTVNTAIPNNLIYNFNSVGDNINVEVDFAIDTHNIISEQSANGIINWSSGYISVKYGNTDYLNVPYGDSVTYIFTPDANYHIAYLRVCISGGDFVTLTDGYNNDLWSYSIIDGEGTLTIKNITEDREIEAAFAVNIYTITSSVDGIGGTISPLGISTVNFGANKSYTFTPDEGFIVEGVYLDGILLEGVETIYTFLNISANHIIEVKFK